MMQIEYRFNPTKPPMTVDIRVTGGHSKELARWRNYPMKFGYKYMCKMHNETDWPIVEIKWSMK